jgi:geranylgeranyl diphosphate synthase, type I
VAQSEAPTVDSLDWYASYRSLVSARLHAHLRRSHAAVYNLCRYHLGWIDAQGNPIQAETGKALRPVLCLTACSGYGDPLAAVDLAASLELLHSFSLVHDDIEDGDRERRHRATLWAAFGIPLAINAGDALFVQAFELLHLGAAGLEAYRATRAFGLFTDACLRMIEGQHEDMEFERAASVSLHEYVAMVRGKTAALLGASLALGALAGGAENAAVEALHAAGVELGLAFQAADDLLAFWGDPAETGKAVGNDLARGKKSLPLVFANEAGLSLDDLRGLQLPAVLTALEEAGSRMRSRQFAAEHAAAAGALIDEARMKPEAAGQLKILVEFAVTRVR